MKAAYTASEKLLLGSIQVCATSLTRKAAMKAKMTISVSPPCLLLAQRAVRHAGSKAPKSEPRNTTFSITSPSARASGKEKREMGR